MGASSNRVLARARSRAVTVMALTAVIVGTLSAAPSFAGDFANFEIDGNTADSPTGGAIDWETADHVTPFTDAPPPKNQDDIFTGGSKNDAPGAWTCDTTGSAPAKDDILSGAVTFRVVDGDQIVFANFRRLSANGDAHVDYEFTQSNQPHQNATCAAAGVPRRTDGDIFITFDTETIKQGGTNVKKLSVRAYEWNGDANTGTLVAFATGSQGVTWDAATGDGEKFGEAALNLTETIGAIDCNEFASVYMKSRASTSPTSALKDLTDSQPLDLANCPDSELHKAVRNVDVPGDDFGDTADAEPGDTIEYRLTYHNHGDGAADGVVVSEEVPQRSTFVSCTAGCTTSGTGPGSTVTWNLGTQAGGASVELLFRVVLDEVFPEGQTDIDNTATVDSDDEDPESSNTTTVRVTAASNLTVDKVASETSVNVGDTIGVTLFVTNSGNADGSDTVVDDYDQSHVTVSNISDGGVDDGDVITWTNVSVAAGATRQLTYDATFSGPFNGPSGEGVCEDGQYPVDNTATVGQSTDTERVCVTASPQWEVVKSSNPSTANISDDDTTNDSVTVTVTVTNIGQAGGSTPVVDDFDEDHVDVSNISDGGQVVDDGGNLKIVWDSGTIPATNPDTSKSFTYTATFHGPFSGLRGTGPCRQTEYEVINTVTVTGDSHSNSVCVTAEPEFDVEKSVSSNTAGVGDSITVTITVTNNGEAAGSIPVVDDYDQDHADVSNISDAGVDDGDTITWDSGELAANGGTRSFTYTVTFHGPFTGPDDLDPCGPNEYPVINTVQVTGDTDQETVCVEAHPDPVLEKSAVMGDGTIVYTIAYRNDGDATAENLVIHEAIPAGTAFASCTGGCTTTGDPITSVDWAVGDVDPDESGSVTLTVTTGPTTGCEVCNTATATADNLITPVSSNEVCTGLPGQPDPANANARDSAFGARADIDLLEFDETFAAVSSSQSGVGTDAASDQLAGVTVPPFDGSVLDVDVMTTSSVSTVTADPARASHTSVAQATGVNVLEGVVTAGLVRGVASTTADGGSSSYSSAGSTFEDLYVNGERIDDVAPNTVIDLPADVFGPGSYVALREEVASTTRPASGQVNGGTYAADLEVNMIHVHVTDVAGLRAVDVIVSNAVAHADFPQTKICEAQPAQEVSGHAFIASETTDPQVLPAMVGYVEIPPGGGPAQEQHLAVGQLPPGDGSTVEAHGAETYSQGTLDPLFSMATSAASATNVCILATATGCTIYAEAVRSQANSMADELGASSDAEVSYLLDVVIDGEAVTLSAAPNQTITLPGGLGFVIFNEQTCDNGALLANDCNDGSGDTGITVRQIHVILTAPGSIGAEIIVAEAHSDALYVA